MTIRVLFFASLREQLQKKQLELPWQKGMTAGDAWQQATQTHTLPERVLIACNQEYCQADHPLSAGDEVAFFPPVTGG